MAEEVGLDASEINSWARAINVYGFSQNLDLDDACAISVPNVWISVNLMHGAPKGLFAWPYYSAVNLGGTVGRFVGTDLLTSSDYKIIKANTAAEIDQNFRNVAGDLWGFSLFAHGDQTGGIYDGGLNRVFHQNDLLALIDLNGYRLSKASLMQCFSGATYDRPKIDSGGNFITEKVNFEDEWLQRVRTDGLKVYHGVNMLEIDLGNGKKPRRRSANPHRR